VQDDQHVRLWVEDNGPGIPKEEQTRLFAPFTQLDPSSVDGHGLGLSIVRLIAEKLDGEVSVDSETGQGSVFSLTLPGSNGHATRSAVAQQPASSLSQDW
jgi:signal transduction histidine kinase